MRNIFTVSLVIVLYLTGATAFADDLCTLAAAHNLTTEDIAQAKTAIEALKSYKIDLSYLEKAQKRGPIKVVMGMQDISSTATLGGLETNNISLGHHYEAAYVDAAYEADAVATALMPLVDAKIKEATCTLLQLGIKVK